MKVAIALALYVVITLFVCSPFVSVAKLGAAPVMDGDVSLNMWGISWDNYALRHQPLHLFQANIFYPHPNSLAFSEHFFGCALLVFPWYWFSNNPVFPYNLLFLLAYFLSAVTMFCLAFHYTRNGWAAWLAGTIYGFCFFRAHHFTHLSLIFNPWLPLLVLAYDKLRVSFRWHIWLALLFLTVLQCLTNWYTAFFVFLILGWQVLFDLAAKRLPKRTMLAVGLLALCVVALIFPFYLPYRQHHDMLGALDEVRYNSANVGSYFQPPFNTVLGQWLDTKRRWIWGERSTYAGYIVLALALVGFWFLIGKKWDSERRYLFLTYAGLAFLAFLLSLGPYFLDVGGLVSPSRILYWLIPPFLSLRAIARLAIVVMFCFAILAALAVSRFQRQTNGWLVPFLTVLFLLEHYPVGLPWRPAQARPFQLRPVDLWLKLHASPKDVLLELPGYSRDQWTRESLYMLYSTQHWLKLVNGYTRFYPQGYFEDQRIFANFPSSEALHLLKKYGVDYVVLHGAQFPHRQGAGSVPPIILVAKFGDDFIYRISHQ